eukprot:COSAG01_NODE_16778_length_1204_cov_134.491403_1_plen_227_part_10
MLRMRAGNPAAFQHLQLEYAKIPSNDSFQDYLPNLVTMIGKYEYFMNSTRAMDRKLGGSRKERAAVIRQAMAFESEDSGEEEEQAALTTFDPSKKRAGVPLCFRTAKEQQERALKNDAGKRLCENLSTVTATARLNARSATTVTATARLNAPAQAPKHAISTPNHLRFPTVALLPQFAERISPTPPTQLTHASAKVAASRDKASPTTCMSPHEPGAGGGGEHRQADI